MFIADSILFYIGIEVELSEGIKRFYNNLERQGHILIEGPEMYDYLYRGEIVYVLVYKSFSKLDYLEYMWQKKEDKNVSSL